MKQAAGKEAFFTGAVGRHGIGRGHRLLRQWEDGSDVCSIYKVSLETPVGRGEACSWGSGTSCRMPSSRVRRFSSKARLSDVEGHFWMAIDSQ